MSWHDFADILVQSVEEVAGRQPRHKLQEMYTAQDQEYIQQLTQRQQTCWEQVRLHQSTPEEAQHRATLATAKQAVGRFKQECRTRWINGIVEQLDAAMATHDLRQFYSILPKLGIHSEGKSREGQEAFSLSEAREHFAKTMSDPLPVDPQMTDQLEQRTPTAQWLGKPPDRAEVEDALQDMRESSPGKDECTALMLRLSGELGMRVLTSITCRMWTTKATEWEDQLKTAVGVLLWKQKGDRKKLDNHRMIVLLSIMSRLLAKIVAKRIRRHCEDLHLLPNFQWGFRPNRCTLDVMLILRLISEMATEIAYDPALPAEQQDPIVMILFDIQKAYPSVPREAAYAVFRKSFGIPEEMVQVIQELHESTVFVVRNREGESEPFSSNKGFREGCPSSPGCFNMYHTVPINELESEAEKRWPCPGVQLGAAQGRDWSKRARKPPTRLASCKDRSQWDMIELYKLFIVLFADDTTAITRSSRAEEVEQLAIQVLKRWGETVHPGKTERMQLGTPKPNDNYKEVVTFLGGLFTNNGSLSEDTKTRLAKATKLWGRVYAQLPRLGIPQQTQARLVNSTVMASLLYGAEVRSFTAKELRSYQLLQNRITFGLSKQRKRTMQADQKTLSDLRQQLKIDTVGSMIDYRKLCYLGHLARKPEAALERKALFSWLEPENERPATKKGHSLRHNYWHLLEQVRQQTSYDKKQWRTQWIKEAQRAEGFHWRNLLNQWRHTERDKDRTDCWQERHKTGGVVDRRRERAQERAEAMLGVQPAADNKYECPHCRVCLALRSMKLHVGPCGRLPPAQRQILAARRAAKKQTRAAPLVQLIPNAPAAPQPAPLVQLIPNAPAAPQPAPLVQLIPNAPAPAAPAVRKRPNRLKIRLRLRGKQKPPVAPPPPPRAAVARQKTAQEVPPPPLPAGWDKRVCHFCMQNFDSATKRSKHSCACSQMPYAMWLDRVKKVYADVTVRDHCCPFCSTPFWTARSAGRHSVVCKQRRKAAGITVARC
jgi:hypothetical protein